MEQFLELKAQDKPEIVSRVFELKVKELIKTLKTHKPLGDITAETRITSPEHIDNFISAEIPDPHVDPEGYKVVSEFMIHGPCGLARSDVVCMVDDTCSKSFPKEYVQNTYFDNNGFVHYRRRDTNTSVTKHDQKLDNSYVVPYNHFLSLRFFAHINVEFCGWTMLIKYLFKYISKGTDKIRARISHKFNDALPSSSNTQPEINEIRNYVEARYICPHEAAWRILGFEINERTPTIQILAVHLENMQQISFRSRDRLEIVAADPSKKMTTLTQWFEYNKHHTDVHSLTYLEFPSEYVWHDDGKFWSKRVNKNKPSIGRLSNVPPAQGELFYLRMLLSHQRGCTCYEDVRRVNNINYHMFRSACEALGLLGDDQEWNTAFEEAVTWATASELRTLFSHMLNYCDVVNPLHLWTSHWKEMANDLPMKIMSISHIKDFPINNVQTEGYVIYEVEKILNSCSQSLKTYGLPLPPPLLQDDLNNRLLMEERNYNKDLLSAEEKILVSKLNDKQRHIYDLTIEASINHRQELIFVYGHGGTGKTFLWKTITTTLRAKGKIVLVVASSGVASLLLPSGRTTHSRFKLPIDITDESVCSIKKGTQLENLLIQTDLILWDEAP